MSAAVAARLLSRRNADPSEGAACANQLLAGPRWPIISALGVVQIFAWGSSYYLLAVLAGPIATDTGWPLAWIVGALSLGLLAAGIVSPRVAMQSANMAGGRF